MDTLAHANIHLDTNTDADTYWNSGTRVRARPADRRLAPPDPRLEVDDMAPTPGCG